MDIIVKIFKKIFPLEIIVLVTAVFIINILKYPDDIGFLSIHYNPYLFIIIFFTSFYGKKSGLITFLTVTIIIASYIIISDLYYSTDILYTTITTPVSYQHLSSLLFLSLIAIIILGEIRDNLGRIIQNQKNIIKELDEQAAKLKRELEAVSMVNQEYQDRILGQQNSLISLYSTIIALNTLHLENIYPNILNAVVQFTGSQQCSLWQYDRDNNSIHLLAHNGWTQDIIDSTPSNLDTENLIGWSVRNNTMFSIKMLQKYQNLKALDNGNSIITVPITIDNQVWGALNIEKIPFIKYNLYTEQLLLMIADLAAPIIRNAIRYSSLVHKEVDPVTGFNSISEFYEVLKEEFANAQHNKLNLSLLIVECTNSAEIVEKFSMKDALLVLKEIAQLVQQLAKGKVLLFQYKETFQFAAILPNMDFDGAAMFSLSLIEQNSKKTYYVKGQIVNPEIVIGYSTLRSNHQSEEDLILLAENLLLMQKI
ncbi:MAG: diguanylate cyclase [Spirochaetota bacterium]|nr:diguanylate cyclase [Spirochaetota bacterium]